MDSAAICNHGKVVIINNWISVGYETVFDVETISKHCQVYKEVKWQGILQKVEHF